MAIAVDEFGGVTGLVTVEDIAHQIVGEIAPPEDEEPAWERISPRQYRLPGGMSIRDIGDTVRGQPDQRNRPEQPPGLRKGGEIAHMHRVGSGLDGQFDVAADR